MPDGAAAGPCGAVHGWRREDGALVLELEGEIDASLASCFDTLHSLAVTGGDPVVVRTARVSFLDAAGAEHLVRLHQQVTEAGRRWVLPDPSPATTWTLRLLAMDDLVEQTPPLLQ